jgi:hypothetical protein
MTSSERRRSRWATADRQKAQSLSLFGRESGSNVKDDSEAQSMRTTDCASHPTRRRRTPEEVWGTETRSEGRYMRNGMVRASVLDEDLGLRMMCDMGVPKKTKAGVGKSIKCE